MSTPEESTINWKAETYNKTVFRTWFIEGIASSVENVYQFRYEQFPMFRKQSGRQRCFRRKDPERGVTCFLYE